MGYNPDPIVKFCYCNCFSIHHWRIFHLVQCPFDLPSPLRHSCSSCFDFFDHFLTLWHKKRLPRSWNQPFFPPKKPRVLLLENGGLRLMFTYVYILYTFYFSNCPLKLLVLFYSWAIFAALHKFPQIVGEPGVRLQILFG